MSFPVNSSGGSGSGGAATHLSTAQTSSNVTIISSTGSDTVIPAADTTNAGVMPASAVTKLAGIAAGATVNSSDALLVNRSNHVGTQLAATISDFAEAAQAAGGVLTAANYLASQAKVNGLIEDGSCQSGTASVFNRAGYSFAARPFGANGAFTTDITNNSIYNDEYIYHKKIPVNAAFKYTFSIDMMQIVDVASSHLSLFVSLHFYDRDNLHIEAVHYMAAPGQASNLALAADLSLGDTSFTVNDIAGFAANLAAANWYTGGLAFFPYTDASGYVYQKSVIPYSRYATPSANLWGPTTASISGNTITLNSPWSYANPNRVDGKWLAGTEIINTMSLDPSVVLTTPTLSKVKYVTYTNFIGGDATLKFLPGTASVQLRVDNYFHSFGTQVAWGNVFFGR